MIAIGFVTVITAAAVLGIFFTGRRLFLYMRALMSANIYETGVIYEYEDNFDEDEHSFFSSVNQGELGGASSREEMRTLRHFIIKELIPNFKHQRDEENGGSQFAVLLLLDSPLSALSRNWTFEPLTGNGRPHVNSRYCTRPPRSLYGNYVVARPQMHKVSKTLRKLLLPIFMTPEYFYEHAETILLKEFEILREKFEAERNQRTRCVILFSWLFPCQRCTEEIIKRFGAGSFRNRTTHHIQRVVIVFAVYWRRIPLSENWKNLTRLRDNGFDIVRVKCNENTDI